MAVPLALIAAIPAILKAGAGLYQTLRGSFMKKPVRPTQGVTPATQQALSRAEGMANRSSDIVLSSQLSDIDRSSANQVGNLTKNIGHTGDLLAGLGSIEANKAVIRNQAYGSFGARKYSYENNLLRAYDALRQEQMNAFEWNQKIKYIEEMTKKQGLTGSGLSNVNTGLSELSTIAQYNSMYKDQEKMWDKLNNYNRRSPTKIEYSSPVY